MSLRVLNGEQAMSYGALAAGVKVVASYPGSPSSGTVESLASIARTHSLHVEWSSNEKVAAEVAIGAMIAGRRALICTKSVGLNAMLDPLMVLNITPVHGGLVILLGDDPGGYGSQNDQDSRSFAMPLEMPLLEPATPAEGYAMMREAFAASERLRLPVIVRITRSLAQAQEPVEVADEPVVQTCLGLAREPWRFVPVPRNVVEKHRQLHDRLDQAREWVERVPFNRASGDAERGTVGVGFAYRKLMDVLGTSGEFRVLKLSALYPLPADVVCRFLEGCTEALVVEETEPFVEMQLKALAHDRRLGVRLLGKQSGHIPREGELFRWQIRRALARFAPDFVPAGDFTAEDEAAERPHREAHCAGCRYGPILDALDAAAAERQEELFLIGDPGCLVTVGERLHAKYAIGSAVAVADGLCKAGITQRVVALFGDSAFFHTALPAIMNAVVSRSELLMVVFDNGATVTSGFQPNPGVGRDALGRPAPALNIERIAEACGVGYVRSVDANETPSVLEAFRLALDQRRLALVIVRTRCER
jgi:indolepyruvate ferredoxin oxidoreductase alpha subunit